VTGAEVRKWLDEELANYPDRTSGQELRSYLVRRMAPLVDTDRAALVEALSVWLRLRQELRTMLAMDIAAHHRLVELHGAVVELLEDVKAGEAFQPYYEPWIVEALEQL
jgi:hypothetical protein